MSNVHKINQATPETLALAARWGWTEPPKEVLSIAEKALFASSSLSGEILVEWGVITAAQRDALLESKPNNVQTLEHFANRDPQRVLPVKEKVLALKSQNPYYDNLAVLTPHSAMGAPEVVKRCDDLGAVLMRIEGRSDVLVFTEYLSLLQFGTLGYAERHTDPIYKALKAEKVLLAVGARDEILGLLKHFQTADNGAAAMDSSNVWDAASQEIQQTEEGKFISSLIDHALGQRATDISIKPFRSGTVQIRMRKWGELIPPRVIKEEVSGELAGKIVRMLAARSGANPSNTTMREPADGQISYRSSHSNAFIRLSFIPLNHLGDIKELTSVSMRLFANTETSIQLDELRIDPVVSEQLRRAAHMPQGLILLAGPVNSGKSSTIAGTIGEHVRVYGDSRKRLSVEDPVERFLYGITQINVPSHIKDPKEQFNSILRAIKRHDLNLLWVGETRDKESAEFCTAFAGSGHLVMSTIHAKDSILAYDILSKMVSPDVRFQLAESMGMVVSQRLVKTICPHCALPASAPNEQEIQLFSLNLEMLGEHAELPSLVHRANPDGCDFCEGGYGGFLPVNEVLPFTREVKDAAIGILNGVDVQNNRLLMASKRTITLLQSGLKLVNDGYQDSAPDAKRVYADIESVLFF